jgi:hypothetical protein
MGGTILSWKVISATTAPDMREKQCVLFLRRLFSENFVCSFGLVRSYRVGEERALLLTKNYWPFLKPPGQPGEGAKNEKAFPDRILAQYAGAVSAALGPIHPRVEVARLDDGGVWGPAIPCFGDPGVSSYCPGVVCLTWLWRTRAQLQLHSGSRVGTNVWHRYDKRR